MGQRWLLWLPPLLAGCAAPAMPPPQQAMEYWLGKEVARVVASWGEPTVLRQGEEGLTYIYRATRYPERYYPVNLDQPGPLPYALAEGLECRGVLETDAGGTVIRARWVGYECDHR